MGIMVCMMGGKREKCKRGRVLCIPFMFLCMDACMLRTLLYTLGERGESSFRSAFIRGG